MPDTGKKNPANNFHFFVALETDLQKNEFPDQLTRFPWVDPTDVNGEERHYEKIRSSDDTFFCYGAKIGLTFNRKWMVYGLIGNSKGDVDLHYEDSTVSYDFEIEESFNSTGNLYFGGGLSFVMEEIKIHETIDSIIGLDLKYRRLNIEENSIDTRGKSYECTVDEIQTSLLYTLFIKRFTPYCGLRISSMTGNENYRNETLLKQGYSRNIDYHERITWFKNIGYCLGIGYSFFNNFSLNVETRLGDEKGISVSTAVFF